MFSHSLRDDGNVDLLTKGDNNKYGALALLLAFPRIPLSPLLLFEIFTADSVMPAKKGGRSWAIQYRPEMAQQGARDRPCPWILAIRWNGDYYHERLSNVQM
jgi:hypothetical protein